VTQPDHSTVSSAVFKSAWTEFCQTNEVAARVFAPIWRLSVPESPSQHPPRAAHPSPHLSTKVEPPPTSASRAWRSRDPNASRLKKAAVILGPPMRTVQALPRRGEIPGAAKIGGRWTFDSKNCDGWSDRESARHWQSEERRPDATGAAVPSGVRAKVCGRRHPHGRLNTDDPTVAKARRQAGKARAVADKFGDARRSFEGSLYGMGCTAPVCGRTKNREALSVFTGTTLRHCSVAHCQISMAGSLPK